jgi:DNA-binding transcriptional regulator YhcF (GntR family)
MADIAARKLKPGDRLPSIRDVARQHGVSAGTAQNALMHLCELGVIYSGSTRGYFVADATKAVKSQTQDQSIAEELDAVRQDLRRLSGRVGKLEEMLRASEPTEPSARH